MMLRVLLEMEVWMWLMVEELVWVVDERRMVEWAGAEYL
jgi:hypothetical protein